MLQIRFAKCLLSTMLLLSATSLLHADFLVTASASGTDPNGIFRSASVTFEQVGGFGGTQLRVTLQNTSTVGVSKPVEVLTAVMFNMSSNVNIAPLSAIISNGSTVVQGTYPSGGNVGGEWVFNPNLTGGLPKYGIGSSGLGGTFGSSDTNFNGPPLGGGTEGNPPDGVAWGLVGAAGIVSPNGGIQNRSFVRNSIDFTFNNWAPLSDINFQKMFTFIRFQYGTALDEGNLTTTPHNTVPVPAGVVLVGIAGAILAAGSYLRQRRVAKLT